MNNCVIYHSCENMNEVSGKSAKLVIASPPFTNNGDGSTLFKDSYLEFMRTVFLEVNRILTEDGILVTINTDLRDHSYYNNGLPHYEGTVWFKHSDLRTAAEYANFKCLDCKIWVKSLNVNVYRYNFAHIMFFSKIEYASYRPGVVKRQRNFRSDIWLLKGGTQRVDSKGYRFHNAIHPEIVERCINEFTTQGELVVSPFTGSGTILAVAKIMGRNWIGYEVDENLRLLIEESVNGPFRPPIYTSIINKYLNENNLSSMQ